MIYVDINTNILYFLYRYDTDSKCRERVEKYPVASGSSERPSPMGKFHIVKKIIYPGKYYSNMTPKEAAVCDPGSMELNVRYEGRPYAIHGADPEIPLAKQESGGCIMMLENDLIFLFNSVEKGQPVVIWDKPYGDMRNNMGDIPDYNRLRKWPPKGK